MMLCGICLLWRCITYFNCIRSSSVCRLIKHMNASRLYSIDFSVICLMTKMASVQDLPDLNPVAHQPVRYVHLFCFFYFLLDIGVAQIDYPHLDTNANCVRDTPLHVVHLHEQLLQEELHPVLQLCSRSGRFGLNFISQLMNVNSAGLSLLLMD